MKLQMTFGNQEILFNIWSSVRFIIDILDLLLKVCQIKMFFGGGRSILNAVNFRFISGQLHSDCNSIQ